LSFFSELLAAADAAAAAYLFIDISDSIFFFNFHFVSFFHTISHEDDADTQTKQNPNQFFL
jgi:hypothetical protein